MKSLRRTLLLNILLLLVVTLGLVSFFVYRTSERAISDRKQTNRDFVQFRFNEQVDRLLRNRADELAGDVQSSYHRDKARFHWINSGLAALHVPVGGGGFAPLVTRISTGTFGQVGLEMNTRLATELRVDEDLIYPNSNIPAYEFIQTNDEFGTGWVSRSLFGQAMGADESPLRQDHDTSIARFDNLELGNGKTVRRVILKTPVTKRNWVGSFWFPRPDSPPPSRAVIGLAAVARSSERRSGGGGGPVTRVLTSTGYQEPSFYLHCAWVNSEENPHLAPAIKERDERLEAIDHETDASIHSLRLTLTWTVAGALAATLVGVWVLVGLGLFPLKRLSVAVSQISTKDFKLPVNPHSLPAEINPVVERLTQTLDQLQAAFEREKRAAADISHELRTPLAALTTTIEVACRKVRTPEQYRQTLEDCRGIARQMSHLVERMLLLAWLDAGADELRPEDVRLEDLVGGVAAIGKPLAENKGLTFRVTVPNPVAVRTDPDKLREVVMNLIHNAIEYNQPGGEVEVKAERTSSGGVRLEVRDTGIGMAPEILDKIFERFFRGDPSRTATGVHAGLGLAIVKEYVDRLGGKLKVDSKVGSGTRFQIDLPNAV